MIKVKNLSKHFGGIKAVDGVDLNIDEGSITGLVGPNGAGKSSTLGMISSLVNKTSGNINVCGYDIDENYIMSRKSLGFMPQEVNLNIFETRLVAAGHESVYQAVRSWPNRAPGWIMKTENIKTHRAGLSQCILFFYEEVDKDSEVGET